MKSALWLFGACALLACKDPALNVDGERVPSRSEGSRTTQGAATSTQASTRATATAAQGHAPSTAAGARPKTNAVEWDSSIPWKSWEEGSRLAKATNKPIFLLVYADWCPHCRNLKAVFADEEVKKLTETMVMIRQDADDDSATWLSAKVGSYGGYVPRIFFLGPDGSVKPEITSNNPKFPYFYTPEGIASLKASMRRAAGG